VPKGTFTAIIFSLVIHGLILLVIVLMQSNKPKIVKANIKNSTIKSYLYYASKVANTELNKVGESGEEKRSRSSAEKRNQENVPKIAPKPESDSPLMDKRMSMPSITADQTMALANDATIYPQPTPEPTPNPVNRKLDSFTQLQRLRSKLNNRAAIITNSPYQGYQPPSVFNKNAKSVPHSVPLKDEEKERRINTKNMGSGIAITKGDDGRCSISQDLSLYGLREGSSRQYFNCGESKFDQSFREHMKKVKAKFGEIK